MGHISKWSGGARFLVGQNNVAGHSSSGTWISIGQKTGAHLQPASRARSYVPRWWKLDDSRAVPYVSAGGIYNDQAAQHGPRSLRSGSDGFIRTFLTCRVSLLPSSACRLTPGRLRRGVTVAAGLFVVVVVIAPSQPAWFYQGDSGQK